MGASRWRARAPVHTSGFAVNLCPPPADTDEQKAPVTEEFGRLSFKGVADELKNPSDHEQTERVEPQPMEEETGSKRRDRDQNCGNAECMADAIDRVLMAA